MNDNNIKLLVEKDLCIGCGACNLICPSNAITMKFKNIYHPVISKDDCINCGKCLNVCPINDFIKNDVKKSLSLGMINNAYIGFSNDDYFRYVGSSGGIISTILYYALENNIIDGAIVVQEVNSKYTSKYITNKLEILSNATSVYYPVDIFSVLKNVDLKSNNIAIVGLPCHLIAAEKIATANPEYAKKIRLKIGLFCGRFVDSEATKYILNKMKIQPDNVISIQYRGNGWPGHMKILMNDGIKIIPHKKYSQIFFPSYWFTPKSCFMCPDYTSEVADISIGDPWNLNTNDNKGMSIILTRNTNADNFLEKFKDHITTHTIPINLVLKTHLDNIMYKKSNIYIRRLLFGIGNSNKLVYYYKSVIFLIMSIIFGSLVFINYKLYRFLYSHNIIYCIPMNFILILGKFTSTIKKISTKLYTNKGNYK